MLTAKEIAHEACKIGTAKVNKKNYQVLLSAMLAGMFIAFGFYGYIIIVGGAQSVANEIFDFTFFAKFLGALVFPVGLILILIGGGDLFTGNCLISLGCMTRGHKFKLVVKNLFLVYFGNLLGALFFVFLLHNSGMIDKDQLKVITTLAEKKVHIAFMPALFRGILCNIIVSMAVYISYAAKNVSGKILAAYLPVVLFVVSAYEHSVANMFLLPMSLVSAGNITIMEIINNLIPVTIGNIIGGAIIIPLPYYILFLRNSHEHAK